MNRNIIIAILAILIVGGGLYYFNKKNDGTGNNNLGNGEHTLTVPDQNISLTFPEAFKPMDGVEDFVFSNPFATSTNSEYYIACATVGTSTENVLCKGGVSLLFGIRTTEDTPTELLAKCQKEAICKSELETSKEITLNGKQSWVTEFCGPNGCVKDVAFARGEGGISVMFYEQLIDNTRGEAGLAEIAEKIVKSLKF